MRLNGEGTFYKDGELFCWKMRLAGRTIVRKAKTQKELRAKVQVALEDVTGKIDTKLTVAKWMTRWLAQKERMVTKGLLAANTHRFYEQQSRCHIVPQLGTVVLARLTAPLVEQWVAERLTQPGLSPDSVDAARRTLKTAMAAAHKAGLIPANPVPQGAPVKGQKRARKRVQNIQQVETFMPILNESDSVYAPLLILLLSSGLRISEALGLELTSLLFNDGEPCAIVVDKQLFWKDQSWSLQPLKTDASLRSIPLGTTARSAIKRQLDARKVMQSRLGRYAPRDHALLFTTGIGSPMNPRNAQRSLDAHLVKAALPHVSLHDLRRTFGSLVARNAPRQVLKELLGHASASTTEKHYVRAFDSDQVDAIDTLDGYFG